MNAPLKLSPFVLPLLIVGLVASGCRKADDAELPPVDSIFLPGPADDDAGTANALSAAQACTQGAQLADLQAWLDEHNDEIHDRIRLLRGLIAVQRKAVRTDGEFEWSVSGDLRTLTLKATVQEDDSIAYSAIFSGPLVSEYEFLSGTTAADRLSGSWTVKKPDGTIAVEVTWSKTSEGVLTVSREHKIRGTSAVYSRDANTASITFTGPNRTGEASWNRESKDGSFSIDGGAEVCWDYEAASSQLCEVACL